MLGYLQDSNPDLTKQESTNNALTECATFADDIKSMGYDFQSDWHFKDQPYLDQGGSLDDYDFTLPAYNSVDAMTDLTAFLKGEITETGDSFYVDQIAQYFSDVRDQQSFALRMIVHYVGDIHQPLHATTLVDDAYP